MQGSVCHDKPQTDTYRSIKTLDQFTKQFKMMDLSLSEVEFTSTETPLVH